MLPRRDSIFKRRARCPSKKSEMPATKKIARAAPTQLFMTQMAKMKAKTMRDPERIFGIREM